MTGSITNLEIFGAGTHAAQTGSVTVTEDDLDQIVDAFHALKGTNIVKPHLKLGHTDAQKWFGQKDGIPALGWINRVWRQGSKLLADVTNIPDALMEMIKSGRYHNVSAEVFWNTPIEHAGKQYTRVLSAVALLGVEMPAVKDLAGLAGALFQAGPIHQYTGGKATVLDPTEGNRRMDKPLIYNQEQCDNLIAAAVAKALKDAEAKFAEKETSWKTEREVLSNRASQAEAEISKVKAEAAQKEATTLVDQAIKDGKLLPKQRDFAIAALNATAVKVKFGEKGEEKSMPELFKDFLGAQGRVIDTSQKGAGNNTPITFSTVAEEVDHKVREVQSKDATGKMDYAAALDKVLKDDADLKKRYAESQV